MKRFEAELNRLFSPPKEPRRKKSTPVNKKVTWAALEDMYEKIGPSAIYDYAINNPQQFEGWSVCDPCSSCPEDPCETPTFKMCCAVCGSIKLA